MLKNPAIVFLIGLGVVLMAGCSLVTPSTQNPSSLSEQDLVEFVSVAELQGTIAFTYLLADAGNYVLQAGEEIVISWEDPPEGAQFYDLVFMNVGESIQWLGAFEIGDDGTLETTWIVPENQTGELIGIARFADESVVRSGCCSNIFSGTFPPEGICALRIRNLAPQYLLEARDQASERIASVPPGIYLELLGRSSGGWYLVQTNQTLDGDQGDTSLYSGWLYVDSGVSLFGPCDGVPIHPDDEPQEPTVLSPGWIEVQDPVSGMRLAVPCFWIVDFPDEGQRAVSGAGTLRNYEYIQELLDPSLDLFEEGAIKIDLVFSNRWVPGDDPLERLYAYQESMRNPDSDSRVLAVAEIEINGQIGLHVQVESIFGLSHYWLFELPDGSFMMFVPNRLAHDHPDVQAILGSIALSQEFHHHRFQRLRATEYSHQHS
jgi:hypothetical protein